jgi:hypothetical protein
MPARSKIQDDAEVRRWLEEGWTCQEMAEEYARKYNLTSAGFLCFAWLKLRGFLVRVQAGELVGL